MVSARSGLVGAAVEPGCLSVGIGQWAHSHSRLLQTPRNQGSVCRPCNSQGQRRDAASYRLCSSGQLRRASRMHWNTTWQLFLATAPQPTPANLRRALGSSNKVTAKASSCLLPAHIRTQEPGHHDGTIRSLQNRQSREKRLISRS